jgi:hypothetical protein
LVFTLLAAAVQTAKFSDSRISDALELLGWIALLASGIAGLWSLEYYPVVYSGKANIRDHADRIDNAPDFEAASAGARDFEKASEKLRHLQAFTEKRYSAHRWLFVFGLACLLIARGYLPMQRLLSSIFGTG